MARCKVLIQALAPVEVEVELDLPIGDIDCAMSAARARAMLDPSLALDWKISGTPRLLTVLWMSSLTP